MISRYILRIAILLAGCISTVAAAPGRCDPHSAYQGPALRAPVTLDEEPPVPVSPDRPMDPDLAAKLYRRFQKLILTKTEASHASIAVWSPHLGYWSADVAAGAPARASIPYWWASVGKMATATIIFQMVDEGKLSLDDRLSTWFPDYPNADLISVDQLLTHTGGVFSFNADKTLQKQDGYQPLERLISVSAKHGPDFCPGTFWNYSNTGYVMLGRIAERIDGKPLADIVQDRIAAPLSLTSLAVVTPSDTVDTIVPATGTNPPSPAAIASIYGAGAYRASAADMLRFLSAYLSAEIVSTTLRDRALSDLYPMFGTPMYYGRGVMVIDVPDPDRPTLWIGHLGGSPNAKALLIYDRDRDVYLALVLNTNAPAEAIANTILKDLDPAL